jgi:hypothetical protein
MWDAVRCAPGARHGLDAESPMREGVQKTPLISQNTAIDFIGDIYSCLMCQKTGGFRTKL